MEGTTGPSEKLLAFIDFAIVNAEEWEDHCTIYIDRFSSPASRAALFSPSAIYDPMKQIIAALVREGQAAGEIGSDFVPEVVAQLFVSIYDGIIRCSAGLQGWLDASVSRLQARCFGR